MKEIESKRARMGGEPTFKNRRLTIDHMLHSLAQGDSMQEFADDYEIDVQHVRNALRDIADNIRSWVRPKQLWELWEDHDDDSCDGLTFTLAENVADLMSNGLLSHHAKCTWSVMAESPNQASEAFNKHMGWDEYKPMLNYEDEPYSEDEGNTDVEADEECKDCGNVIDSCGYCTDLDCSYSECLQDEETDE